MLKFETKEEVVKTAVVTLEEGGVSYDIPPRVAMALGKMMEHFKNSHGRVMNLLVEDISKKDLEIVTKGVLEHIAGLVADIQSHAKVDLVDYLENIDPE